MRDRKQAGGPSTDGPRASSSRSDAGSLQRAAGNRAVSRLVQGDGGSGPTADDEVRSVLRSTGKPLDAAFRARAESFLGADLAAVRVHTGSAAADSARAVGAHAYTSGDNVVFGAGMYDTASPTGQERLAHELTHVVQQRSGPVAGTVQGGLSISDPADRFERAAELSAAEFVQRAAWPEQGTDDPFGS